MDSRADTLCGRVIIVVMAAVTWMKPLSRGNHSGVWVGGSWLLPLGLEEGWGEKRRLTWSSDHLPGRRF